MVVLSYFLFQDTISIFVPLKKYDTKAFRFKLIILYP